eukprot:gene21069-27949_t
MNLYLQSRERRRAVRVAARSHSRRVDRGEWVSSVLVLEIHVDPRRPGLGMHARSATQVQRSHPIGSSQSHGLLPRLNPTSSSCPQAAPNGKRSLIVPKAASSTGLDGEVPKPNFSSSKSSKDRKARSVAMQTYWSTEPYGIEYDSLLIEPFPAAPFFVSPALPATHGVEAATPLCPDPLTSCHDLEHGYPKEIPLASARGALRGMTYEHLTEGYENHALDTMLEGKSEVTRFYLNMMPSIPDGATFVLEDVVDGGDAAGFAWHLELAGIELPMSRGVGMYKVDQAGRLLYIRDCPEQVLRMALPALSFGSPFLKLALPALLPTAIELGLMPRSGKSTSSLSCGVHSPDSPGGALSCWASAILPSQLAEFMKTPFLTPQSAPRGGKGGPRPPGSTTLTIAGASTTTTAGGHAHPGLTPTSTSGGTGDALGSWELGFVLHSGNEEDELFEGTSFVDIVGGAGAINFSGIWEKDVDASDHESYENMLDALQLGFEQKQGAQSIDGLEMVHVPHEALSISFLAASPSFGVTEHYRFGSGENKMHRSLSSGQQQAKCVRLSCGGVMVHMALEEPTLGQMEEQYRIHEDGHLHVRSSVTVGGKKCSSTQVYCRSNKTKEQKEKKPGSGSVQEEVLAESKMMKLIDILEGDKSQDLVQEEVLAESKMRN